MSDLDRELVVEVKNVSKSFDIGRFDTSLRTSVSSLFNRLLNRSTHQPETKMLSVLENISFNIYDGEGVAIVGRNGVGKTTLLRLLSGISEPTSGTIQINGRFVSLLGFGAGFDQERTGRENIYLNCALYGVSPDKTNEIIDDIVEFSELDNFIDQPIKVYSSGMNARLGFSVAIHILPRIFFLDEVLAVGDFAFRKKCLDRIREMKDKGVTVIFVSHSSVLSKWMCERAIWIHRGAIRMDGDSHSVIDAYEAHQNKYGGGHPSLNTLLEDDVQSSE